MFSVEIKKLYWIDNTVENQDDVCLHGDVAATIGNERFEESCTVSATALYLLKTLSEDHIMHNDNQMLPCCGHVYVPNETNDIVQIYGCPSGTDWTVLNKKDKIEIVTESGTVTSVGAAEYKEIVYAFADKVQSFYAKCPPRSVPQDDFDRKGYLAFWNEWSRRRGGLENSFFCPAVSREIDIGLCWEYCFAGDCGPNDTTEKLNKWISKTYKFKDVQDFHNICKICTHCQWFG